MRSLILLLFCILFCRAFPCFAQQAVTITDPRIEKTGNKVLISYDILNSHPSDLFTIEVSITDSEGRRIQARSLAGDLGENVAGGKNKQVSWDLEKDAIQINANIYIELIARHYPALSSGDFNRTSLILQSLAFPGLGMTRYTGSAHWIKGVAGYGCLAGSVILNRVSVNTYNSIEQQADFNEKRVLHEKSVSQYGTSKVLAYAAIGIWVADIVWTVVGTSGLKMQNSVDDKMGLSIGSGLDPLAMVPMVKIRYGF